LELSWKVSANNGSTLMPNSRCYIQPLGRITPLLSQEGWREAPGWFHSETLDCGSGTTPPSHHIRK